MDIWLAVLIGAILVAIPIFCLCAILYKAFNRFEGIANMFFATQTMQLQIELDEYGYECPEWLKTIDEEEQPLEAETPTVLSLVKIREDK